MNERIRQLADEAGLYVDLYGEPWPKSMSAEECEVAYKKFAELIVKECVQEVEGMAILMDAGHDQWNRAIGHTVLHLKEHFGVEE